MRLVDQMKQIGERLSEIRVEIPPKLAKTPSEIPQIDDDFEFPEKHLEVSIYQKRRQIIFHDYSWR